MGFNLNQGEALLTRQLPGSLQLIAIKAFGDRKKALCILTKNSAGHFQQEGAVHTTGIGDGSRPHLRENLRQASESRLGSYQ